MCAGYSGVLKAKIIFYDFANSGTQPIPQYFTQIFQRKNKKGRTHFAHSYWFKNVQDNSHNHQHKKATQKLNSIFLTLFHKVAGKTIGVILTDEAISVCPQSLTRPLLIEQRNITANIMPYSTFISPFPINCFQIFFL